MKGLLYLGLQVSTCCYVLLGESFQQLYSPFSMCNYLFYSWLERESRVKPLSFWARRFWGDPPPHLLRSAEPSVVLSEWHDVVLGNSATLP